MDKYRNVIRLILFLYGKRTYSIDELCNRLAVSKTSINDYFKIIKKMPDFGFERTGKGYFARFRINPDTTVFKKELKGLCKKLEQE